METTISRQQMEKHTRHTFWRGFVAAAVIFATLMVVQIFFVNKLVDVCLA